MQHAVVATQLNAKRKYTKHWYTHGTQQLQQYTTFTVVHNIHDPETFGLPERQVASTMILALILSSTLSTTPSTFVSVLGVVVRGTKKHYVNVKTERTLRPRN